MDIKSNIISVLVSAFSKEVSIIFIAALPVFELRLAIPLAIIKFNLSWPKAYCFSLLGNLLPVIPLLLFFKFFFHKLENVRFAGRFFQWWFKRVEKKAAIIRKWGFWGLVCFVAIPLPVTGAWTGTVAATLLEMNRKKAFSAIVIGVSFAGIIVTILSLLVPGVIKQWFIFT